MRRIIVLVQAMGEISSLPDVKLSVWIAENINRPATLRMLSNHHVQGIGSSGRIRTYDQSVNSRPLYH